MHCFAVVLYTCYRMVHPNNQKALRYIAKTYLLFVDFRLWSTKQLCKKLLIKPIKAELTNSGARDSIHWRYLTYNENGSMCCDHIEFLLLYEVLVTEYANMREKFMYHLANYQHLRESLKVSGCEFTPSLNIDELPLIRSFEHFGIEDCLEFTGPGWIDRLMESAVSIILFIRRLDKLCSSVEKENHELMDVKKNIDDSTKHSVRRIRKHDMRKRESCFKHALPENVRDDLFKLYN